MSSRRPATVSVAMLLGSLPLRLAVALVMLGLLALAPPAEAAFPGANGKIAFSGGFSTGLEIQTMGPGGGATLTHNGAYDRNPSWSADGRKIAFDSYRDGRWEVYAMNADGTGQVNLTNNTAGNYDPAWSPDGTKIAFSSQDEIYTMNANGTGRSRLTFTGASLDHPEWSPNGDKIAVEASGIYDSITSIYTINADGSGITRLTAGPGGHPTWSPDGSRIAFQSGSGTLSEIYSMNADGSGQTKLTNNSDNDSEPAWSPDGTKIAFVTNRTTPIKYDIYEMNADGTAQKALGAGFSPSWQPVDITAPQTSVDAGPSGPMDDTTPTFSFSSNETESTFECRVDANVFTACASAHTTSELAAGPHVFEVRATDPSGNTDPTPASRAFTVLDTIAPETTISTGPSGSTPDATPIFKFSTNEPNSTFQCRVDSAAFASCVSPHTTNELTVGPHTFEVRATDAAGNIDQTPASRSILVLDITAPETTIDSGPSGPTPDPTPTFTFASSEPNSTFRCRIDYADFASCSSPHTTGELSGPHTFEVRATDAAGNTDWSAASRSFVAPPQTTISSGPTGLTNDPTPTFGFTASAAGSTYECRLDGVGFVYCASPFTAPHLNDGVHTLDVRAIDPSGHTDTTPASRTFSVDGPPDTIFTAGPPSEAHTTTATFKFNSTQPGSTFQCRRDGGQPGPCVSPWSISGLADGSHSFEVVATDPTGNVDPTAAIIFWSVDTSPAGALPPETSIISGPSGSTKSASATFEFSASEPGSTFACRLDTGGWTGCSSPITYSGLSASSHAFYVRATDQAGNEDVTPALRAWTIAASALPPVGKSPPPGSSSTARDLIPPVLTTRPTNPRRAVKHKGLVVEVMCPTEACTATAAGRLLITGAVRAFKVGSASARVEKGDRATLKLRFSKRTLGIAQRMLRKGKAVRVQIVFTATDAAGNVTTARRTIRLKRF